MRYFDLTTMSMTPSSGIAETKIPLWWADGMSVTASTTSNAYLNDGSASDINNGSPNKLFTLSSNWPVSLNFALEVTLWSSNSTNTVYAELYDFTSIVAIAGSKVSTTTTTATVIRSGQFTLTPGHQYGVTVWTGNISYNFSISDASLIVFPQ